MQHTRLGVAHKIQGQYCCGGYAAAVQPIEFRHQIPGIAGLAGMAGWGSVAHLDFGVHR